MLSFTALVVAGLSIGVQAQIGDAYYSYYKPLNGYNAYAQKQFPQTFYDGYSILKHYGGNGPYSDRVAYGIDRNPPTGCQVDQVIGLGRHGERYPDPSDGVRFQNSLSKIYQYNQTLTGDLAFLKDWTYFVPTPAWYAQETFSGPYAGLLSAYTHGTEYRARYGHLWNGQSTVPIFASGYERIIETARKFGEGFFGYNYSSVVALNIIPEQSFEGANSLTPSCTHDNGTAVCNSLTDLLPVFNVTVERWQKQNPGLNVNATDVYNLMQMAAFELNARPFSDWIGAFSLDEWAGFGYTQDLNYYYCSGPGDPNMAAVGQVYVNATMTLLNQGPKNGSQAMYWSFCHDTNITPVIAALGILNPASPLPTDRVAWGNPWSSSNIVPMQGHVVLERLSCNATAISDAGKYVRIVLNEAVVPMQQCQSGPGYSCPLSNYTQIYSQLPSFTKTCGINSTFPQYLSFFWKYNTTNALDYQNGTIPYQQGYNDFKKRDYVRGRL